MVTIDQVCEPSRAPRGSYNGIKLVLIHERIDAFGAGELMIRRQRLHVLLLGKWSFRLRFQEKVLPEVGHFFLPVMLIKLDDVLQGVHRPARAEPREGGIEI